MEKILSIVIPAYNSGAFLNRVLDSLLEPSVLDYLDIIVVNDGSKDNTAEAAQGYCDRYPDSIRLINQENKGHGGALNTGIAAAVGKFVKVVDSDDWVETQNLAPFVEQLREIDSDVVLTHFTTHNIQDGSVTQWKSFPKSFRKVYSLQELVDNWDSFNQVLAFHGLAYRTTFYHSTGVRLTEHVFYEDQEYATLPLCRAKAISALDLTIYDYRVGDANQSMSQANQLKNIRNYGIVLNRLLDEASRLPQVEESAQLDFFCLITKSFLTSYLMNIMLLGEDRKQGRIQAAELMDTVAEKLPLLYARTNVQYRALRVMSVFNVSKADCDKLLDSKFYNLLRHRHCMEVTTPEKK